MIEGNSMNIQAIIAVYTKMIKELTRFPISIFFMIVFPLFFITIFGIGFGGNNDVVTTFSIGIVNNDVPLGGSFSFADDFIKLLENLTYNKTNTPVFNIRLYSDSFILQDAIKDQSIQFGVELPENFSLTLLSARNQTVYLQTGHYLRLKDLGVNLSIIPSSALEKFTANYNCTVLFIGDTASNSFQIIKPIFLSIIDSYSKSISGLTHTGGITVISESINSKEQSIFDTIVPGIFVFALILQISVLGSLLTAEYESGTLNRIILSPIDPVSFLTGLTLYQLTITTIQFPVMLLTAYVFGFSSQGNYLLSYILLLLTSFSVIGFSFIVGSIIKHPDTAGMLGGLISAPLAFISGAFVSVPQIILIKNVFPTSTGVVRDFSLYDLLPTTHAVNALNGVLLRNYGPQDILFEICSLILISIAIFFLGVLYFTKKRLMRAS